MECPICENQFEKNTLYENERIRILLASESSATGHIQIFSREHYPILEAVPEDLLSYMSNAANKISILLFKLLKVHGTNIIIQNGVPAGQSVPHFSIHIIPRRADDGMKIDWAMNKASPEALDNIHNIISEGMNQVEASERIEQGMGRGAEQKKEEAAAASPKTETKKEPETDEGNAEEKEKGKEKEVNYFLKSIERIP